MFENFNERGLCPFFMPQQFALIHHVLTHGGPTRGRRKTRRPFDARRPVHLVLKASRARGEFSLLRRGHAGLVMRVQQAAARKYGVKILRYANVGNHLHYVVKARSREAFQAFLRVLTGQIAMRVLGGKKGVPRGRFWDDLAWTRVVAWGRDLQAMLAYLAKNLLKDAGFSGLYHRAGIGWGEIAGEFPTGNPTDKLPPPAT